jgi:hypothetical protein
MAGTSGLAGMVTACPGWASAAELPHIPGQVPASAHPTQRPQSPQVMTFALSSSQRMLQEEVQRQAAQLG